MARIFISYRRDDSQAATGRIWDRLVEAFGRAGLFRDIDAIPLGVDFRSHIDDAMQDCILVVAIIGDRWLDSMDQAGNRRLDNPEDFVRLELERALAREIPVIPVLLDRTLMPRAEELPESLAALAYRNAAEVDTGRRFDDDMTRLIAAIETVVGSRTRDAAGTIERPMHGAQTETQNGEDRLEHSVSTPAGPGPGAAGTPSASKASPRPRRRSQVAIAAVVVLVLAAGGVAYWQWQEWRARQAAEQARIQREDTARALAASAHEKMRAARKNLEAKRFIDARNDAAAAAADAHKAVVVAPGLAETKRVVAAARNLRREVAAAITARIAELSDEAKRAADSGAFDKAEASLRAATTLDPSAPALAAAWRQLAQARVTRANALISQADAAMARHDFDLAAKRLDEAEAAAPGLTAIKSARSRLKAAKAKFADAERRRRERDPPIVDACDRLAGDPWDPGRNKKVSAAELPVRSKLLGAKILSKAWFAKAVAACQAATERYPNAPRFFYQLGLLQSRETVSEPALRALTRASEMNYPAARAWLGFHLTSGADKQAARRGFDMLTDTAAVYPVAAYLLGRVYESGLRSIGLPADLTKALTLYRKAATATIPVPAAMHAIGKLYRDGKGVASDRRAAAAWFQKAARLGEVAAQYDLGRLFETALGDPSGAARWYGAAARNGHIDAQLALGQLYRDGKGVKKDLAAAARWFRKVIAESRDDNGKGKVKEREAGALLARMVLEHTGTTKYAKVSSLTGASIRPDGTVTLSGLTMVPRKANDELRNWQAEALVIRGIDWSHEYPYRVDLRYEGVTLNFTKRANIAHQRAIRVMGLTRLRLGHGIAYVYDAASKTLDLKSWSVRADGIGIVDLRGTLTAVDAKFLPLLFLSKTAGQSNKFSALAGVSVAKLSVTVHETGGLLRYLALVADASKTTVTALRTRLRNELSALRGTWRGSRAQSVIDAVSAFFDRGGQLELRVAPLSPVSIGRIVQALQRKPSPDQVEQLIRELNLSASTTPSLVPPDPTPAR